MSNFVGDTNIFLRYLLRDDDSQYKKISTWLEEAQSGRRIIHVYPQVFFEMNFVCLKQYLIDKKEVTNILQALAQTSYLKIKFRKRVLASLALYKKYNISLVDCWLLQNSHDSNMDLLTFDKKLLKTYSKVKNQE